VPAAVTGSSFQASVPLVEGTNTLTAVAANSGGTTSTGSVQLTLDTTPPRVAIESPADGSTTTDPSTTVSGTVNDIVVGTVNSQQAQVTVNGAPAQVANRSFLASGVALAMGPNTIQAIARDRSGNSVTTSVQVIRVAATQPSIRIISGNNQSGPVSTTLAAPLIVALDNGLGQPVANTPVVFRVTDNNGLITAAGNTASSLAVTTNATGRAQVSLQLGSRAGAGSNRVEATSSGFVGTAAFTATGTSTGASLITVDSGNNQTGALAAKLAFPFVVVVTDAGFNRLGGVPVTFTVKQGGGSLAGKPTLQMNTDPDGRAAAFLTLGTEPGLDNNVVEASFTGNKGQPAGFVASAKTAGNAADTRITGVVLDNSNAPIEGVTVRLFQAHLGNNNNTPIPVGTPVKTDAQGQFLMNGAPVGFFKLMADGTTVAPARGVFPTLEYDLVTVAGQDNTVGMPLLLPLLDQTNKLCVDQTTGGTLTLPAVPGFSLTVAAGTATFPGGSKTGCVTVSTVNPDKSPMTPGFGQQPRFLITIQPVGTMFNGPAPITMPNVDGLKPGQVTELYSYDHDLAAFTAIGTGTVSEDGLLVRSDPGVGILKAGWHCGGNPTTGGTVAPLTLNVDKTQVAVAINQTFSITANGSPPVDAVYEWTTSGPAVAATNGPPTCPNSATCVGNFKGAAAPGAATISVCVRCTTTGARDCKTVNVSVVQIKNITFKNGLMSAFKEIDQSYKSVGTFSGKTIRFSIETDPANATIPASDIQWSGAASGSTREVDVAFLNPANTSVTVTVLGVQRTGSVRVVDRPTGIGEAAYALLNPIDTAIALANNLVPLPGGSITTLEPFIWASAQYPGTQHNTIADAARHAYWNCTLAVLVNPGYAAGLTFQHEVSSTGPATETIMDLTNNAAGRAVAAGLAGSSRNLAGCRTGVISDIAAGTSTLYLDSSHGAANTNENALLQPTNR
jgi:hypothetical protein